MSPSERTRSLEDINKSLDELYSYKIHLVQKYIQLTFASENEMKEGYIQMARARYLAGASGLFGIPKDLNLEDCEEDVFAKLTVINDENHRTLKVSSDSKLSSSNLLGISKKDERSYKKLEAQFQTALERNIQRINTVDEIKKVTDKISDEVATKLEMIQVREPWANIISEYWSNLVRTNFYTRQFESNPNYLLIPIHDIWKI